MTARIDNPRVFDWHLPGSQLLAILRDGLPSAVCVDIDDDGKRRSVAFRLPEGVPLQSFFRPMIADPKFFLTVSAIATAQGLEVRYTFPHDARRES